jgi:hypothetical protein
VPCFQPLHGLIASGALSPVGFKHLKCHPIEDRLRNDQLLKKLGKLVGQTLLARIGFGAFASVASAMVVHVAALLEFPNEETPTTTAMYQTRIGELVLHLPCFVPAAYIQ